MGCHGCQRLIAVGEQLERVAGKPRHLSCVTTRLESLRRNVVNVPQPFESYIFSSPLRVPDGRALMPYQRDAVRALARRARGASTSGTLLGDEMGLGKTVQAISLINQMFEWRSVLVVTSPSLLYNWVSELEAWLLHDPVRDVAVFRAHRRNTTKTAATIGDSITCVSYTNLALWMKDVNIERFDAVIVDEAHLFKNPDAQRTQALRSCVMHIPHKIFLTGSAVENHPAEIGALWQMLEPEVWTQFPGVTVRDRFYYFATEVCGGRLVPHPVRGGRGRTGHHLEYSNTEKMSTLHARLRESGLLLRRRKADVLVSLPEKRRELILLAPPSSSLLAFEHAAFERAGLLHAGTLEDLERAPVGFEDLAKARLDIGLAKVAPAAERIRQVFEQDGGPLVIFTHHLQVLHKLAASLSDYHPVLYHGGLSAEERDRCVKRFQAGETDLFLGTLGAAGVGITLTRASHGIFVEFEWKDLRQAEDRIHRIGQKNAVLWQYLAFLGSVDANMLKLIWRKMAMASRVLDGES